jgi:alkaline phosphatase D
MTEARVLEGWQTDRRNLLRLASAASMGVAVAFLNGCSTQKKDPQHLARGGVKPGKAGPLWRSYPFALGVASGSPRAHSVVLWTRLVGDLPAEPVPVFWELASDQGFKTIVAKGRADAVAEFGHSIHIDVEGLAPQRAYFYRFMSGDAVSASGITRTAPSMRDETGNLRLVLASCQNWQHGYFHAWTHAAADHPDLVVFVGDYIYEYGAAQSAMAPRKHDSGEIFSLADYRARYALYKSDPSLQAAHATAPWIVTWDDHEVANDYANDQDERLRPGFLQRRVAAYQAFWENMPLSNAVLKAAVWPQMAIFDRFSWGRLADIHVLDDRQYRDYQACPNRGRGGGSGTVWAHDCAELADAGRTLLGKQQELWLAKGLAASQSRWNVIAQQTLMTETNQASVQEQAQGKARYWTDGWDGYRPARERLYSDLKSAQARGHARDTLVLSGDVHAWYVADLKSSQDAASAERSAILATEFCGTSITSNSGWTQERVERIAAANPHYHYARADRRGYTLLNLNAKTTEVQLRAVEDVRRQTSPVQTLRRFEVRAGKPGLQT